MLDQVGMVLDNAGLMSQTWCCFSRRHYRSSLKSALPHAQFPGG